MLFTVVRPTSVQGPVGSVARYMTGAFSLPKFHMRQSPAASRTMAGETLESDTAGSGLWLRPVRGQDFPSVEVRVYMVPSEYR